MADGDRQRVDILGRTVALDGDGANADLRDASTRAQLNAADPKASVWVSANAGTGKTHTLTSRVARLLLSGTKPEHILCLTFTRAAAAQMQTKLFARLGAWSTMAEQELAEALLHLEGRPLAADEIAQARRLFARALETPGGLKIQTIHAFCESLLGRFPLEAGISPHFTLADDRQSAELLAQARDKVLQHTIDAPDGPLAKAAMQLAGVADEAAVEALLQEISGARHALHALVARAHGVEGAIAAMARTLGVAPGTGPDDVVADALSQIDLGALRGAIAALAGGSKTDKERADLLKTFLADPTPETWAATYRRAFLTDKGAPRDRVATNAVAKAYPDIAAWLKDERDRAAAVEDHCRAARTAVMSGAILRLGAAVLEAYAAEKAHRALLDYDDLITRTANLLASREATQWVLYKLDLGLDHILVDEAQDTSPQQWRVIEALVAEFFAGDSGRSFAPGDGARAAGTQRTLFAVGDEKQSIFSFQGAEPGTFAAKRQAFRQIAEAAKHEWRDVALTVSWRTADEILAGVDTVFASDAIRDGVAAGAERVHHESVWTGRAGLVEVWPPVTDDDTGTQELWDAPLDAVTAQSKEAKLAARITGKLKDWIGTEFLPQRGRRMRPGDVLILVRRRGAFVDELMRQLKTAHIPVAGVDRLILAEHMAVMDLMALARFAVLPEDDLTLATVLRGPLCTVSETALFEIAHARDGSLWRSLQQRAGDVDGGAQALAYLTDIRARVDILQPHDFFARVLGPLGGRAALIGRLGMDAHDPIDEFLNQALAYEATNTPSLQGFIAWMAAGTTEIKRDLDQGGNEVRIMTVHGAKGLEANVVILPDTVQAGGTPGRQSLVAHDDGLITYAPRGDDTDASSRAARDARTAREDAEYRRLLYVAMTRAKDRLYIAAAHGRKGIKDTSWYARVRAALSTCPGAVEEEVMFADGPGTVLRLASDQLVEAVVDDDTQDAPAHAPLPDWIFRPAPGEPQPVAPLTPSAMAAPETDPPALSPLAAAGRLGPQHRFTRGRLIHTLLQHLPEHAPDQRAQAARAYLAHAAGADIDADGQAAIAREVLTLLDDARMAPLFAPGSRAEVALAGHIVWRGQRVPVAGQVDRMVVLETQVLIADYKTNRPPPDTVAGVAPVYLDQMAAYRALAQAAYPGHTVTCALVWTDGPRLMVLPDVALNERIRPQ